MKSHPMLFNTEMVRAIIDGRKDVTRRVMKSENAPWGVGDLIWVKETFAQIGGNVVFRADSDENTGPWRPSMFMPRRLSRIDLRVVDVRGERLHEIDNADALREGTPDLRTAENGWDMRDCYAALWDSINAKRGYAWASNPMVWRIEFKVEEVRG